MIDSNFQRQIKFTAELIKGGFSEAAGFIDGLILQLDKKSSTLRAYEIIIQMNSESHKKEKNESSDIIEELNLTIKDDKNDIKNLHKEIENLNSFIADEE